MEYFVNFLYYNQSHKHQEVYLSNSLKTIYVKFPTLPPYTAVWFQCFVLHLLQIWQRHAKFIQACRYTRVYNCSKECRRTLGLLNVK